MNTAQQPLAERLRPRSLGEFFGQRHLTSGDGLLRQLIMSDSVCSLLLWGPPGVGKTTLARIVAVETKSRFVQLSAVTAGVKDVKEVIAQAESSLRLGEKTILFIDEIHRFNKKQQDALLPSVEDGTIVFVGATTENPSFSVNNALLSRCRVFVLEHLSDDDLLAVVERALSDSVYGLGGFDIAISSDVRSLLVRHAHGDARVALSALELSVTLASSLAKDGNIVVSDEHVLQAFQKTTLLYDKTGDEHYNVISALHKSMRGGDADASFYWLARMLEGGEDPLYVARRLVRFASEDVGLANSLALPQAVAAYDACRFIGMPECGVNLAQAVVYLAKSKKSNALYRAYGQVCRDVREYGALGVPIHLRNAPTELMKDLDYGKGYKYTPNFENEEDAKQQYLPDELSGRKYIDFE
ncbi:MAG: replication-associated recombination protein A [Candidatus Moranbacteria bacterium]|nr:replication-associated recombination protein A [Candidatus Moranbacteria bacterium]